MKSRMVDEKRLLLYGCIGNAIKRGDLVEMRPEGLLEEFNGALDPDMAGSR